MFIIRTKCFIKLAMMKNYDQSVEIFHNPNWPYISDHRYRISIIGGPGSGKGDVLLNLTKHQGLLIRQRSIRIKVTIVFINGREKLGIKNLKKYKVIH